MYPSERSENMPISYTEFSLIACVLAERYPWLRGACFNNLLAVALTSTVGVAVHRRSLAKEKSMSLTELYAAHALVHYAPIYFIDRPKITVRDVAWAIALQVAWGVMFVGDVDTSSVYPVEMSKRAWALAWVGSLLAQAAPCCVWPDAGVPH
jgi:hypothetical protein